MRLCKKWSRYLMLCFSIPLCCAAAQPNTPKVVDPILEQLRLVNPPAMRRALTDLEKMFPDRYPKSDGLSARIDELAKQLPAVIEACKTSPDPAAVKRAGELLAFQRELLVERNPLVDFEKLMLIRRRSKHRARCDLGLPDNSSSNPQIFGKGKKSNSGMDNEIVTFSLKDSYENYSVVYRPPPPISSAISTCIGMLKRSCFRREIRRDGFFTKWGCPIPLRKR